MTSISKSALALAFAGTLAAGLPAAAAPVHSSTVAIAQGAGSDLQEVRWRGHRGGWGRGAAAAGFGLAAGALIGSAIASGTYGGYYGPYAYGPGYAYAPGYDGGPVYAAPPAYVAPRGGSCWISTGGDGRYGYWAPC